MTGFDGGRDTIRITGIRGHGYHGVLEEERATGQEFVVDVAIWLTTARAALSDDLSETVDYGDLASRVHALIEGPPHQLIETLAERIAAACLADGAVHAVEVTVHKPSAPVDVPFGDISVTVRRRR